MSFIYLPDMVLVRSPYKSLFLFLLWGTKIHLVWIIYISSFPVTFFLIIHNKAT